MDDILLAANDNGLLHEVKQFLSEKFDMKNMGEASYIISIRSIEIDIKVFWVCLKKPISTKS